MLIQSGHFTTKNASKYLIQLCKHFAHKVSVDYDTQRGVVNFPFAQAHLEASMHALHVELRGQEAEMLARGRSVIDVHLKTFAFREDDPSMSWELPLEAVTQDDGTVALVNTVRPRK